MRLQKHHLEQASKSGVISSEQAETLWTFLNVRSTNEPGFKPAHILFYLGGFVAISAMSLFVTLAWNDWSGLPMLIVAMAYAVIGIALTHWLMNRNLSIPAGIAITFSVATVPLAVYSLQHMLGFWEGGMTMHDFHVYIDWRWVIMELVTLAAASIALWRYRMTFTVFVVGFIAWYLSMDLVPFLFHDADVSWQLRKLISMLMGAATIALAFWVDVRSTRRKDYSFWLYLFGVVMFWGGLTFQHSDNELSKFFYLLINLLMLVVGATLMRRVFAVFSALGIIIYLWHLTTLFKSSLLFPILLAAIGLGVIFLGIIWQKNEKRIQDTLLRLLPVKIRELMLQAHS